MSEKTVTKKQKIIYYSVLALLIVLIGVVTVIAITQKQNGDVGLDANPGQTDDLNGGNSGNSGGNSGDDNVEPVKPDDGGNNGQEDNSGGNQGENEDNKPVAEVITFIIPVDGGSISKEYTDNSVVYSSTLGVYTGHMGIDFKGGENAKVFAVYKGTVKEITTSYLTGTTVKIDHGNGLVTVYNSIEPLETLKEGSTVNKGDVIGTVSENNKQEYKDGPHLHFEVFENDVKISPLKYLSTEEK